MARTKETVQITIRIEEEKKKKYEGYAEENIKTLRGKKGGLSELMRVATDAYISIREELIKDIEQTKRNCRLYELESEKLEGKELELKERQLVNEIGVVRGLYYAAERYKINPLKDEEFVRLIDIQNKLIGK